MIIMTTSVTTKARLVWCCVNTRWTVGETPPPPNPPLSTRFAVRGLRTVRSKRSRFTGSPVRGSQFANYQRPAGCDVRDSAASVIDLRVAKDCSSRYLTEAGNATSDLF